MGKKATFYQSSDVSSPKGTSTFYAKDAEPLPEQTVVRERLKSKSEIWLTYIGYVVGPGNLSRFPYLVLKTGGVWFIFAYLVAVALVALPLSLLELVVGQYSGKNTVKCWDLNPAFRGVGFSMILLSVYALLFFHILMAQCMVYAFNSFTHKFPWLVCKPEWERCAELFHEFRNLTFCKPKQPFPNCTCIMGKPEIGCTPHKHLAAVLYFHREVLGEQNYPEAEDSFGYPRWDMAILLLASWLLVLICVVRGMRYTTRFLYPTVLIPCLSLVILVVAAGVQEGSVQGLELLVDSQVFPLSKLADTQLWSTAVIQAVYSHSTLTGTLHMLGSYKDFHTKPHWDLLVVSLADTLTSLVSTLAVVLCLGRAIHVLGKKNPYHMYDMLKLDMNLMFVVFPSSIAIFPAPHIWNLILFVMLYTLTIDTEFGIFETVMTYLQDDFRFIRRNNAKCRVMLILAGFLIDLLLICPGGNQWLNLMDRFSVPIAFSAVGFFEMVAILWFYGFNRLLKDFEYMMATKFPAFVKYVLFLYSLGMPVFFLNSFIEAIMDDPKEKDYHGFMMYTPQDRYIGISCGFLILSPILIWFALHVASLCLNPRCKRLTTIKFLQRIFSPLSRWGPNDGTKTHRDVDTVFADIFPTLACRRQKKSGLGMLFPTKPPNMDSFAHEVEEFYGPSLATTFAGGDKDKTIQESSLKEEEEEVVVMVEPSATPEATGDLCRDSALVESAATTTTTESLDVSGLRFPRPPLSASADPPAADPLPATMSGDGPSGQLAERGRPGVSSEVDKL